MKRITVAAVTLLLSVGVWIAQQQVDKTTILAAQTLPRFEITRHGTLQLVRNARGVATWGKEYATGEGYYVSYQLSAKKKSPKSEPKFIGAIGEVYPGRCEECEKRKNSNEAVASVITPDQALMITSSFKFDPKTQKLSVSRIIENVSADSEPSNPQVVHLVRASVQFDPRLSSGRDSQAGIPKIFKKAADAAGVMNRFGFLPTLNPAMSIVSCQWCPDQCDVPLSLRSGDTGIICVDCPGENGQEKTFVQMDAGKWNPSVKCTHPIQIFEWSSNPNDIVVKEGESWVVCVKCPKPGESVATFSAKGYPSVGATTAATIKSQQDCTFTSTVTRSKSADAGLGFGKEKLSFVSQDIKTGISNEFSAGQSRGSYLRTARLPLSQLEPRQKIVIVTEYDLSKEIVPRK